MDAPGCAAVHAAPVCALLVPQSQRLSTRFPRKRTCEFSTPTERRRQKHSRMSDTNPLDVTGATSALHRVLLLFTCGPESHSISREIIGKDDGAHARLAAAALAHQQHFPLLSAGRHCGYVRVSLLQDALLWSRRETHSLQLHCRHGRHDTRASNHHACTNSTRPGLV
jgi:hypothetical protein